MAASPLSGIRILDLSWVLAGPLATSLLGSLGAEVLKVESRTRLDQTRTSTSLREGEWFNTGRMFNSVNHSKKSIALNLKHPEAGPLLRELAIVSDVLVENYATGALERMGIDIEAYMRDNPRLIVASSSGFGRTGPSADWVAYGNNIHAASGLTHLIHYHPEKPLGLLGVWSDPVAAYSLAFGIVSALQERDRTGAGGRLDLSMLEASALMLSTPLVAEQIEGSTSADAIDACSPAGRCYRCAGEADEWIAIAVDSQQAFAGLCAAMEVPALLADPRFATAESRSCNSAALGAIIARWTESLPRTAIAGRLAAQRVPYGESQNTTQMMQDPHLRARGFFRLVEHPDTGEKPVLRPAWQRQSGYGVSRAPRLGEHTDQILRDVLGLNDARVQQLRSVDQLLY